ncbi:MAG: ankyrin repeat domain-containing protein [Gemmataceae bacterium]
MKRLPLSGLFILWGTAVLCAGESQESLWKAAKEGDASTIEKLIKAGIDVNAKSKYGATALSFASDQGHLEVVKVLVRNKADVNVKDSFYKATPLTWALSKDHPKVVGVLLKAGAKGADKALITAVSARNGEMIEVVLRNGKLKPATLNRAVVAAATEGDVKAVRLLLKKAKINSKSLNRALALAAPKSKTLKELLKKAGAKEIDQERVDPKVLRKFTGEYTNETLQLTIALENQRLVVKYGSRQLYVLLNKKKNVFQPISSEKTTLTFTQGKKKVTGFVLKNTTREQKFRRVEPKKTAQDPTPKPGAIVPEKSVKVTKPQNWPSFRGLNASGVADGQFPPLTWDGKEGHNVRWKTAIAGLGHSCPVVWGDRLFVTSAISSDPDAILKSGLYGNVDSVDDDSVHTWHVYCLDKNTGKIIWEKVAHRGVPKLKRHAKSTHANCTVATDGKYVVALFASEGMYCYDFAGKRIWKKDLGTLSSGWFYDTAYQWGFGSSPIIYRQLVIVQCDTGKDSFIAAYRLQDGKEVWKTPRNEIPSWSTPTVYEGEKRAELITNATKFVRAYDPLTGTELWRLGPNSEIAVPTPIYTDDLIIVMSGYRTPRPLYAIRPGARGEISPEGEKKSKFIAWQDKRGGTYMPTPILYGDYLYTCSNRGTVNCYKVSGGKRVYSERLRGKAYTASPVAADGKIYFTSEEGLVQVIQAGPKFKTLAINPVGDVCLSTPAISDGMIFVRSKRYVFGIGRKAKP